MTEPKNALVKQYAKLMEIDGVKLTFESTALKKIAHLAIERKTGARGLRSIIENTMRDVMFDTPSQTNIAEVVITPKSVDGQAHPKIIYKKDKQAS